MQLANVVLGDGSLDEERMVLPAASGAIEGFFDRAGVTPESALARR